MGWRNPHRASDPWKLATIPRAEYNPIRGLVASIISIPGRGLPGAVAQAHSPSQLIRGLCKNLRETCAPICFSALKSQPLCTTRRVQSGSSAARAWLCTAVEHPTPARVWRGPAGPTDMFLPRKHEIPAGRQRGARRELLRAERTGRSAGLHGSAIAQARGRVIRMRIRQGSQQA